MGWKPFLPIYPIEDLGYHMVKILTALLSPVVRFSLSRGVHLSQISEILKRCLVLEAQRQIAASSQKVTVSRIAVMTGVSRREVVAALEASDDEEQPANIIARVVQKWTGDKRFRLKSGGPRPLTFKGTSSDFSKLASLVSQDLNPATVLFELERLKLVECREGEAHLKSDFADYGESPEKKLDLLGRNIDTVISASEANIYHPSENPELVLRTEFDNLVASELPQLKAWIRKEGLEFHKRLREKLSRYDKDLNETSEANGGGRIVVLALSHTEVPTKDS